MIKNLKIFSILIIGLVIGLFIVLNNKSKETNPFINSNIEVKTFQIENDWGYDVLIDGELYVHQPNIPSMPGDSGFKTEEDARKVAEIVINKIRNNILPPSVSPAELKDLEIIE
ncbi:MAG: hypothetical protein US50_C0059G0005 [Candidatus Nomurabacteria bacterium GW2011_GWB1_37_5]|uniref:DUF4907 domain-containing protein n=1 Tax=Candidatus Nomurabacteria bacterium GW2011_GWB1_37_5 TaxID=1618742 RepID=A0A0G0GVV6_9BACT|nr:MAG: hypothetical protein US50_C0059G0005 [Candidatus Nomurabacteria bacterium GW2011_GWB1_37_5]